MLFVRSGRHPHEILILLYSIVAGFTGFFGYNQSGSSAILRSFPSLAGQVFYLALAVSAGIAFSGILWRGIMGPLLERAGLIFNSGLFTAYSIVVFTLGLRGITFGMSLIAFGIANVVRVVQISRDLKTIPAAAVLTDSAQQLE